MRAPTAIRQVPDRVRGLAEPAARGRDRLRAARGMFMRGSYGYTVNRPRFASSRRFPTSTTFAGSPHREHDAQGRASTMPTCAGSCFRATRRCSRSPASTRSSSTHSTLHRCLDHHWQNAKSAQNIGLEFRGRLDLTRMHAGSKAFGRARTSPSVLGSSSPAFLHGRRLRFGFEIANTSPSVRSPASRPTSSTCHSGFPILTQARACSSSTTWRASGSTWSAQSRHPTSTSSLSPPST